jgi:hypothetical protein
MPNPTVYDPFKRAFRDLPNYGQPTPYVVGQFEPVFPSAVEPIERPTGVAFCPVPRLKFNIHGTGRSRYAMSMKGSATIYDATGQLTASGEPYGNGVAIAPAFLNKFPYGTQVKITDVTTGKSVVTRVVDTGNFGPGHKYPTAQYGVRVIDLPRNLAMQLGVSGTSEVVVEEV